MKLKFASLCAGLVWALSSAAFPASAKDFHLLRLSGVQVKWGDALYGTPATIRYAFATASFDDPGARNCRAMEGIEGLAKRAGVTESLIEQEAAAAFAEWNAIAGISFMRVANVDAADLVIGVQRHPRGYAFTNVRTKEAGATIVSAKNSQGRGINLPAVTPEANEATDRPPISPMEKALICFNPEREWKVGFGGNAKAYDIRYTLLHEIGHVIGLDHVVKRAALMNFKYTEAFRSPQIGDVEGAQLLYGPPAPLTR